MAGLGAMMMLGPDVVPSTPAPGPFSPLSVPGIQLWLRSDLGIGLSGSNVTSWADQSGTGDSNKNVTQSSGGEQPTYNSSDGAYNNYPSLSFSSGSAFLSSGSWASPLTSPWTVFIAAGNLPNNSSYYIGFSDLSTSFQYLRENPVGLMTAYDGGPGIAIANSFMSSQIWALKQNSTSSTMYVSQLTGTPGIMTAIGLNGTSIGYIPGYEGVYNWIGKMAEVIIYSGVPSTSDFNNVMNYLGTRYGITIGS